jgi:hypothetical protein
MASRLSMGELAPKRHQGSLDVAAVDAKKVLISREEVVPPTEFESVPPA